jgi:putative ABC transport system permease protein
MIRNYLKSTYRNIIKNRIGFAITIIGITAGLVVCILISLFVNDELSYDKFHVQSKNIYRVADNIYKENILESQNARTFSAYGPALKEEYPEVVNFCRIRPYERGYNKEANIQLGNERFKLSNVFYADSTLFSVFTFTMNMGNSNDQLRNVNTAIISKSVAENYFSDENPLGKIITINNQQTVTITGVYDNLPSNSHLKCDLLVSYVSVEQNSSDYEQRKWDHPWQQAYTYVLLNPNADYKTFAKKLPEFISKHKPVLAANHENEELFLQPLERIHLHSNLLLEAEKNGDASKVWFLSLLAISIMVIAWLSYLNLSTSMAFDKLKEVSIRKIIGCKKIHFINQFIIDGLVVYLISFVMAIMIILLAEKGLNQILEISIAHTIKNNLLFMGILLLTFGAFSILINTYPSIIIASVNPSRIISSGSLKLGKASFRKVLVVFQFVVFIILIIGSLTIVRQFKYIKNKDLGINIDNTIVVQSVPFNPNDMEAANKINAFKAELNKHKNIESITSSTQIAGQETNYSMPVNRLNKELKTPPEMFMLGVDYNFLDEYNVSLTHGRGFSEELDKNMFGAVMINESAAKSLKYETIQQCLNDSIDAAGIKTKIVGVFKDFYQLGFKSKVPPMLISLAPNVGYLSIKYNSANHAEIREFIKTKYELFFPQSSFEYFYLNEFYFSQYNSDFQFGKMFYAFMIISMIISCLALFGFSYYATNKRMKEIGIRKINGAKVSEILSMLNKDFIKWVVIAFVIATPIAYYAMQKWLENFAYKTSLSWWIFALAGLLALGVALLTVSFQSWKAATKNPVESLRYE